MRIMERGINYSGSQLHYSSSVLNETTKVARIPATAGRSRDIGLCWSRIGISRAWSGWGGQEGRSWSCGWYSSRTASSGLSRTSHARFSPSWSILEMFSRRPLGAHSRWGTLDEGQGERERWRARERPRTDTDTRNVNDTFPHVVPLSLSLSPFSFLLFPFSLALQLPLVASLTSHGPGKPTDFTPTPSRSC